MKKYFINIMLMLISLLLPYKVKAIEVTDNYNLTINYVYDDYKIDNVEVKLYYVADIDNNYKYQLNSNFLDCKLELNTLTTNYNWDDLKNKLDSYIKIRNIKETMINTIYDNKVIVTNLKKGLYFITIDKINIDNKILLFDSSLINIYEINDDNYNIEIYPKAEVQYIDNINPVTGDNISLYLSLFISSLVSLILLVIIYKKYIK